MSDATIAVSVDGRGVAELRLARPLKRNAMNAAMIEELSSAAAKLGADDAVRAVVLTAEGEVFCAGGDLAWMMTQIESDRSGRIMEARKLANMLRALNECPKPLIAKVHGDAYGGGLGLMSVCDVVIAAGGARFALTETKLGLIPATIGPYVAARLGEAAARRVFMSARRFDADEAVRLGLVARVASAEGLAAAVEEEVAPYLKVAPGAVGAAKSLLRFLGPRIDAEVIEQSVMRLADVWETEEARAGVAAFLDKRPAPWS